MKFYTVITLVGSLIFHDFRGEITVQTQRFVKHLAHDHEVILKPQTSGPKPHLRRCNNKLDQTIKG